jgi:hypothetical protein
MAYITKRFSRKYLREELEIPYGGEIVLEDKVIDTTRWSEIHFVVFRDPSDGQEWGVQYSVGATEFQDERPWENEEEIVATRMIPRPRPVWVKEEVG